MVFRVRGLGSNPIKYLTIMLEDDLPKIFGLDKIDKEPLYVVEGPFDSTFLENSMNMCGSDGEGSFLTGSDSVCIRQRTP